MTAPAIHHFPAPDTTRHRHRDRRTRNHMLPLVLIRRLALPLHARLGAVQSFIANWLHILTYNQHAHDTRR